MTRFGESLVQDEHGIWRSQASYELSYPEHGNEACFQLEDASFWFRHRNECILAAIRRFPPPAGGTIVDVGGGNGFVTKRLIDEGFPAILVEPGPAGALNAKTKRALPEVICATFEDVGFPKDSLPAVGMFDVLEHLDDDVALLEQVHAALTPGGLLYATVPAHRWLWSLSDVNAGHYRRHNTKTLRELLFPSFQIEQLTYFFQPLVLPLLLLRSFPYRVGLVRQRNMMQTSTEHGTGGGLMSQVFARLLTREVDRISRGKRMATGTSCLVVARAS
jgi:SAM-dependent methyltransferase